VIGRELYLPTKKQTILFGLLYGSFFTKFHPKAGFAKIADIYVLACDYLIYLLDRPIQRYME
jgi:hypothetical protein